MFNWAKKNSLISLKFDKIIIYDYEHGEDPSIIDSKGLLSKLVKIKKQIELDKATSNKLNLKLSKKESYGNSHADCFEPHLGIVYYLKNAIVGDVLICFDCNRLNSSTDIPAQKQGKHGKSENVYYTLDGLSKSFRHFINELLKKYSFSHQIKLGSMFDK